MTACLLLTIRFHGDGQGCARFHGSGQGKPEWPPSPARLFQALVAGSARGRRLTDGAVGAFEWLEALPPPVIAAPPGRQGMRLSLFVPNNDADTVRDPRDVSEIRTKKVVQPILFDEEVPLLYVWSVEGDEPQARCIVEAANDLYQLGRGVDLAWAVGELVESEAFESRLSAYGGTIHRPEIDGSVGRLACPTHGSIVSLVERHHWSRLTRGGAGRSTAMLYRNPPKPIFRQVGYERTCRRAIFELREPQEDTRAYAIPLHRAVALTAAIRDAAAAKLAAALPDQAEEIDRLLVGRRAAATSSPTENRARLLPVPSIGHEFADHSIRRIVLEVPSGAAIAAADVEWAFSGLRVAIGQEPPFILVATNSMDMIGHYRGPARRWRTVTAAALPHGASRRRIEPTRRRAEAKAGNERRQEEGGAVAAVHDALRHARVRACAVAVEVRREPFEARGARADRFADARFTKERLWHVAIELDRSVEGPLVLGDGRFLGLGVMAPVREDLPVTEPARSGVAAQSDGLPRIRFASTPIGLYEVAIDRDEGDSFALARALRRAVMARAQADLGRGRLGRFFSGHATDEDCASGSDSNHVAFHWDPVRRRLLILAPHWLDRRSLHLGERRHVQTLDRALRDLTELRAGAHGRFVVQCRPIRALDPLLREARAWRSVTPYAVTRHRKRASAAEALIEDVVAECTRRAFPRPAVTVEEVRGVPGRGLEGRVQIRFAVGVQGPIAIGRTRYLGGGLFEPTS